MAPTPLCDLSVCAAATEMAFAAQESARTAQKVQLPLSVGFAPLEVAQHPIRSGLFGKKLLLYADSHFGSEGREGIAEAFEISTGVPLKIIDAEARGLSTVDFAEVDAVLIYHTQKTADDATKVALQGWVQSGKPLLILHAGQGAWPDWEEYGQWCGKVWDWSSSIHPHQPAELTVTAGDPLHFGWSSAWLPKDEVFVKLKDTAEVIIGLTATISDGFFPAAWRNAAHPNIAVWMPGHRRDSWKLPAMREGATRTLLACSV